MKVLAVASEVFPLVKTGGLADVTGALPRALAEHGIETRTLLPGYPAVLASLPDAEQVLQFSDLFGAPASVRAARVAELSVLVIDAPHLYARSGAVYGWPDDALRFAALARVAAELGLGAVKNFVPDVVHCHDWQAGLAAAYLRADGRTPPATVMTVHNLAFQGQFPPTLLPALRLPPNAFTVDGIEYYGSVGYLKAGLQLADCITTVSPTYAAEIQSPALGMGMDGVLRHRAADLVGILNGIDTSVWDPARDAALATSYSAASLSRRRDNKAALQAQLGLPVDRSTPLFGIITRLSWQKGIDLVTANAAEFSASGAQLVVLGSGDAAEENAVRALPQRLGADVAAVRIGYDEALAHRIQAGVDALIVPSRFEPCGLTQLCALRYGAVPVVARTGGLIDSVIDASPVALAAGVATGVQFERDSAGMLASALRRTVGLYRDEPTWQRMQANGMATDVSWRGPAQAYARLYRELRR
ncbi:MAG: glycogen synthase GlgA [Acidisphaera sp.]|nr:glycogen synthase GlgA [Acidisphaera sp.]MBV9813246.1 glycogen synthase GlgA [Acetobacteraceae bacterium]